MTETNRIEPMIFVAGTKPVLIQYGEKVQGLLVDTSGAVVERRDLDEGAWEAAEHALCEDGPYEATTVHRIAKICGFAPPEKPYNDWGWENPQLDGLYPPPK